MQTITEWEREEKRQEIVDHIRRCGSDKNFKVTDHLIRYWWDRLNAAVFGNALDSSVRLKAVQLFYKHGHCYGLCGIDANEKLYIKIDSLNLPKHLGKIGFITILVHEMVHQYQIEYRTYLGHGKTFKRWTDVIEHKLGLPLTDVIDGKEIRECYEHLRRCNICKGI